MPDHPFEIASTYSGRVQEIHPGIFGDLQFEKAWKSEPLILFRDEMTIVNEPSLRGIAYRVLPLPGKIDKPVKRGDVIALGGQDEPDVKYIVTVRRTIGDSDSMMQVNAYTRDKKLVHWEHLDWPTFVIAIPNHLCHTRIHELLLPYYTAPLPPVRFMTARRIIRYLMTWMPTAPAPAIGTESYPLETIV